MIKHITPDDLRKMNDCEGLILQGCGGEPQEWLDGVNKLLTEADILLDGDTFKDVSVFEHNDITGLLFDMDDVKLDAGKLAMWRLKTHDQFGGTWLSDYLPNRLGVSTDEQKGTNTMLIINAKRNGYSPEQCGKTLTVGELIRELECFDSEAPIYFCHDNGYTYGSVTTNDFEEREVETEDESMDETEEQGMRGHT
jgi:hypothetical protein